MAQDFAPLLRSIWSDDDWRSLSVDAQWAYKMLLSHPDRNSAGVLPLTVRKWTRLSVDLTAARLLEALSELDTAGFVVMDEETEEVLVRSFIRRATVYKHIRMLANALREASEVESPRIGAALAQELARLPRLSIPDNEKMKAEALAAQARVDAMSEPADSPPDGPGHGMADGMAHPLAHPPVVVAVEVVGAVAVAPTSETPEKLRGGSHVSSGPLEEPPLDPRSMRGTPVRPDRTQVRGMQRRPHLRRSHRHQTRAAARRWHEAVHRPRPVLHPRLHRLRGRREGGGMSDYEWHIEVQQLNHYGDRVEQRTPMVVTAANRSEVTTKVRAAFGATYDDFRKFWSHNWTLREVREAAK
jgi:hypothetical protein